MSQLILLSLAIVFVKYLLSTSV